MASLSLGPRAGLQSRHLSGSLDASRPSAYQHSLSQKPCLLAGARCSRLSATHSRPTVPVRARSGPSPGEEASSSPSTSPPGVPNPGPPLTPSTPVRSVSSGTTQDHPELPYTLLTLLSSLGALETAYLTYEKLFQGPLSCPFGGSCNDVLDSSYGTLLGLPLSLYGFLSYASVAFLAQISRTTAQGGLLKDNVRWVLLGLTTLMSGVSAFLLYVIKFELDDTFCSYCLFSAGLSGLLLALTFQGFNGAEVRKALAPQALLVTATALSLSFAFSDARFAQAGEIDLPPVEPEVTTASTPVEVRLAKHLSAAGARMYGAFWCSHCYDQKQAFGGEASKLLPYVECYPEGYRRGVKIAKACEDAKIEGFPTWVINGEMRPGEQDLAELARLTGFDPSKPSK